MNSDASTTCRFTATSEGDAQLYALVHNALEQNAAGQSERREGERGNFACTQLVAPYDGGPLPDQAEFRHVECCDLSTSGFSFVTSAEFESDLLVIALGRVPFQFFLAEIVNRKRIKSDEQRVFRVGCQFRHRISQSKQ